MAQIRIKRAIEAVPGGMMVVPLFAGAFISTFFPQTATYFGSFTGALFNGALSILAVFYVCMGASIDVKATPYILKKGGTLFGIKVGTAAVIGIVMGQFLGESPIDSGLFYGLSTLAVVAALNDTNGGLYMALMGQYGKPRDVGAYSLMSYGVRSVLDHGDSRHRWPLRLPVANHGGCDPASRYRYDHR